MLNKVEELGKTRKVRVGQTANNQLENETALHLSRYARIEIAGMVNDYYFNRLEFEKFCKQLCKEQREICQRISLTHAETGFMSRMIANADEPKFL